MDKIFRRSSASYRLRATVENRRILSSRYSSEILSARCRAAPSVPCACINKKTPAGNFRANWRDSVGDQKAKTFSTRKEAAAFLADVEGSKNRGTYVSPHAGRVHFRVVAERWLGSRDVEARTAGRTVSLMRTHVMPKWGRWPLAQIDHMTIQEWVSGLNKTLAPATVAKCHRMLLTILDAAIKNRHITVNPAAGVKVGRPKDDRTVRRDGEP